MNILGIETSCDETSSAVVVDGRTTLSNVISSQWHLHERHGGVVPELAARGQVRAIVPVVQAALHESDSGWGNIDAIAVTNGPGLAGSLLVGVNVAKTTAFALGLPLIPVNHLEAHIAANWLSSPGETPPEPPALPALCLLVSGGHTELILIEDHGVYRHLGRTLDDAAGEAFDKGGRLLGIGFPGGPAIERLAQQGEASRFSLPRAWLGDSWDFSFSGLKTALLRVVDPYRLPDDPAVPVRDLPFAEHRPPCYRADMPVADLAAAFQEAVVEVLAVKTARAANAFRVCSVLLAGGVAANSALRERVTSEVRAHAGDEVEVRYPPISLCTDNAAMVAGAGYFAHQRHAFATWELDVEPRLSLAASELTITG